MQTVTGYDGRPANMEGWRSDRPGFWVRTVNPWAVSPISDEDAEEMRRYAYGID